MDWLVIGVDDIDLLKRHSCLPDIETILTFFGGGVEPSSVDKILCDPYVRYRKHTTRRGMSPWLKHPPRHR